MGGQHLNKVKKNISRAVKILFAVFLAAAMVFTVTKPGQRFWYGCMKAAGLAHFTAVLEEDMVHIHVIDVGKADAILIESADAAVLIDTATADRAEDVLRYIAARHVDKLDAVWVTHGDDDHAGGLSQLSDALEIGTVYRSPYSLSPSTEPGTQGATVGSIYDYGAFALEVLAPYEQMPDENNNSLVLKLQSGTFTMLFCGDAEEAAENAMLSRGVNLKADVLKTAHHGSDTSTSNAFLEACSPDYAVISVGQDRNELPRNTVLKRFGDRGIPVFRTDEHGTVVISTDGSHIQILTETAGMLVGREQEQYYEENDH